MVKFGTLEYYKKVAEAINSDGQMAKSGFTTTQIVIFTDTKKGFFMNIKDGKVVDVKEVSPEEKAEFSISGDYNLLAGVAKGEINSMKANPKANMIKAMKNMKTLNRMGEIQKNLKDVEY